MMKSNDVFGWLPERFQWTFFHIVANPVSEILFQIGLGEWSEGILDWAMPCGLMPEDTEEEINRLEEALYQNQRLEEALYRIEGGDNPCHDEAKLRYWAFEALCGRSLSD